MPIQTLHLRSSVQGKEPVAGTAAGQLPVGSIGINFNVTEPFLTIQDSAGNIRRIAGIKVGATAPATPTAGEAWLDTTITAKPVFKVHDGTAWQGAGSGTSTGSTAPSSPTAGDLWVDTTTPAAPALKVHNGTAWVAVAPDATTSAKGVVQLADAAAITAGTASRAVQASQLKATNDALATAVTNITNLQTTVTTIQGQTVDATTTAKGIVQLADAAAVTAGTAGRVVTADQLKTTNDTLTTAVTNITAIQGQTADATTTTKGIVQLADAAAITAGTAGRVVTADQLKANVPVIADASTTVKGVVQLATSVEAATGTDTAKAVTPKALHDGYLAKNIALLPALP